MSIATVPHTQQFDFCDITETGVVFHRVPSADEFAALINSVSQVNRSMMWIIGDTLLAGESSGYIARGRLREACQAFGIAYNTAAQAVRVCKAFESCLRRQLSWHHHKVTANREDAAELLQWAEERKSSVAELVCEVRRRDASTIPVVAPSEATPSTPAATAFESDVDFAAILPRGNIRELALFAGAGGGILGGLLAGWRTICAVEQNHYAAAVLAMRQNDGILKPFPIWDDVTTFDGTPWRGRVDVVSGGFPCQDISVNGNGIGIEGTRSGLWSHMARIIREVGPRYVFVENSPALTSRGLGRVLGDLASMGFDAQWGCFSAASQGAPHKRKRLWIVANSSLSRRQENVPSGDGKKISLPSSNSDVRHFSRIWRTESRVQRVAHGVANRMDRLTAIGNGQVPAVAATAWNALGGDC